MIHFIRGGGNYVASPLGVLVLLSAFLTSHGPKGETAVEICEAIVGRKERKTCNNVDYPNIEQMIHRIRTATESSRTEHGRSLYISNAAFLQKGMRYRNEFVQNFAKFRGDHVEQVRFVHIHIKTL